MSFLSSQYVAPSLNGIIELTDGEIVISNGNMSGASHIETGNITINNTINVPEIITSNIQTQNGTLVIGDISDNIFIYGSEIKLIGNVIGYDSANVYIVDNRIELNSGGGNLLLPNSGISVLGDGNIAVSSLLTDNNGDWVFSSPNNIVTMGTLKAGNVEIDSISFDNLSSANITATNKFFSPEKIITDRAVNRSSAISHINCKDIKASYIKTNILEPLNINSTGNINASFFNALNGLSFSGETPFKIDYGLTGNVATNTTITFNQTFTSNPVVLCTGFINSTSAPITYIRSISSTQVQLYAKDPAGADYGTLRFFWVAIGI